MGDVIDISKKLEAKLNNNKTPAKIDDPLIKLGLEYDLLNIEYMSRNIPVEQVTMVMAHRLGALTQVFTGDKDKLLLLLASTMVETAKK